MSTPPSNSLNSMAVEVCPQCLGARVVFPRETNPAATEFPHDPNCQGVPQNGTWVPQEHWPAFIDDDGQVTVDDGTGAEVQEADPESDS